MWLVNLIPIPYRLYAFLALMAVVFLAGWQAQTIWDGYWESKQVTKEVKAARDGQAKIIKFNSDFSRETANAKDDACLTKPMPDGIRVLIAK